MSETNNTIKSNKNQYHHLTMQDKDIKKLSKKSIDNVI